MTSRAEAWRAMQKPDMDRRIADMIRIGTVEDTDYTDPAAPRVRVSYGNNTTGWIPWTASRAGRVRTWEPLKVGEQVIMASPSGDLAQAVIVGSLHQNSRTAPAKSDGQTVAEWDSGIKETIDDDAKSYTLDVPAGGKILLRCGRTSLEITDAGIKLISPRIDLNE